MLKSLLLSGASCQPLYAPLRDDGGGGDVPTDDLQEDILAAYDEVAGGDDGADTKGLADGRTAARGPSRQGARQGEEGADDEGDRGDGRTPRGRFAAKGRLSGDRSPDGNDGTRKPASAAGDKSALEGQARD